MENFFGRLSFLILTIFLAAGCSEVSQKEKMHNRAKPGGVPARAKLEPKNEAGSLPGPILAQLKALDKALKTTQKVQLQMSQKIWKDLRSQPESLLTFLSRRLDRHLVSKPFQLQIEDCSNADSRLRMNSRIDLKVEKQVLSEAHFYTQICGQKTAFQVAVARFLPEGKIQIVFKDRSNLGTLVGACVAIGAKTIGETTCEVLTQDDKVQKLSCANFSIPKSKTETLIYSDLQFRRTPEAHQRQGKAEKLVAWGKFDRLSDSCEKTCAQAGHCGEFAITESEIGSEVVEDLVSEDDLLAYQKLGRERNTPIADPASTAVQPGVVAAPAPKAAAKALTAQEVEKLSLDEREELRTKLGLAPGDDLIAYVADLEEQKSAAAEGAAPAAAIEPLTNHGLDVNPGIDSQ